MSKDSEKKQEPHSAPGTSFTFTGAPNKRILDKHFISKIVSEEVTEFSLSPGSKVGDNMMGTLLTVDVKTKSKRILHLVIKSVLPMAGLIDRDTLISSKFIAALKNYPREVLYYETVRPMLHEAFSSTSRGGESAKLTFSRPVYHSGFLDEIEEGLYDYIVLEDLRPAGYKMADKFKSLNFDQVSHVMKHLAALHATSHALLTKDTEFRRMWKDPQMILNFHEWDGSTYRTEMNITGFFNGLVSRMLQIARENGLEGEANSLEKYSRTGHDIQLGLSRKTDTAPQYFPVLVHGDLWTNNILFKYCSDGRTVEDVKFIDWQLTRIGNIYEDLHYFFYTSTDLEFRRANLKSCFKVYFQEFSGILQDLGTAHPQGFTEESMMSTFLQNLDYGLCYGIVAIPFQLGLHPPPPSPMTPLELSYSREKADKEKVVDPKEVKPDWDEYLKGMAEDIDSAARNSKIAIRRITEIIQEVTELLP